MGTWCVCLGKILKVRERIVFFSCKTNYDQFPRIETRGILNSVSFPEMGGGGMNGERDKSSLILGSKGGGGVMATDHLVFMVKTT